MVLLLSHTTELRKDVQTLLSGYEAHLILSKHIAAEGRADEDNSVVTCKQWAPHQPQQES